MKHQIVTLLIVVVMVFVALPVAPISAQDSDPYSSDQTLGRGLVRSVAWSPDGEILAVGGALGIWLYTPEFEDIGRMTGHTKAVYGMAFSPDGSQIASVSHDMTVRVWDIESQTERHTMEGHTDLVVAVAWNPDGKTVVSGSYDGTIRQWNPDTGEALGVLGEHDDWVDDLAFSADGSQLASVGHDGMLKVWDVSNAAASGDLLWEQLAHEGGAQAVTWALKDGTIASAGRNGQIKWWETDGSLKDTMDVHSDVIYDIDPKPDTLLLGTASWDGTATHWHLYPLPEVLHVMRTHTGRVHRAAWRPDGSRLATLGWDDTVRMWDPNAIELAAQHEHMDFIVALAWSDDGANVIDVTLDGRAHIWDVESGELLETVTGRSEGPSRFAESPDWSRRAEIDDGGIVRIVDAASGDVIMELPGRANAVSWSPDGSRLAVAVRNGTIKIWSETVP